MWTINCRPVKCKQCRVLNYFISKKIYYFKYLAFIPTKYFKAYRKFIKKQKEIKKKLFEQIENTDAKAKIGRKIGNKLRRGFIKICLLATEKENPVLGLKEIGALQNKRNSF